MPHNTAPSTLSSTYQGHDISREFRDMKERDKHRAEEQAVAGDINAFSTLYAADQSSADYGDFQKKKKEGEALLGKIKGLIGEERIALVGNRLWQVNYQGAWSPFGAAELGTKNTQAIDLLKQSGVTQYPTESELPGYGEQEYGAPSITKEAFFDESGNKKKPQEIARTLKAAGAEGTYEEILQNVIDFMPELEEVSEEEKGFAKEARERDVYGLQKEARKAGAQMRGAYGGMGGGMRAGVEAGADIAKGFEFAQQDYKKDIYGLQEGAYKDFESEVSATFGFRGGGRVPYKGETFLSMLSQLPDAGGS